MSNSIAFLTQLIGFRDAHGNAHGQNVTLLSSALARAVDFPSKDLVPLKQAATIHDIGKITISDFVMNKSGRLTEAEHIMIQQHTTLGHKLIAPLDLPTLIMDVILSHHENYDGSGYPHKLIGDNIPLAARIIRITDTYDALTSDRGYRPAYTRRKAVVEMERTANCYDPVLLKLFFNLK
jgi:HD-GYP domain-containing protein (c-di-GMP phosphodiesterase class II)